ncbi:Lrp/AsnC family transcriptional regulator [Pseudalkalibacillus decolorationis]|uniref:Lrp/AsnC family transcriptional regulator n=1 Tax=Pseudalkalibacillus decolorationis TaxID=163879 RepID=UPI0021478D0A|nr:Lrp/AsnC family transcriptional regulator [Pseudalkalibacillus decolorationis]
MLDHTDKEILKELLENSRISMKQLGEKVHLTGQAAANRVLKLEEEGVIENYTVTLNQAKIGYPVHTFINIYTKSTKHDPYLSFLDKHQAYVKNNYKISGDGCYLLECRFPDNSELDEFLTELNHYTNYKLSIVINKRNGLTT